MFIQNFSAFRCFNRTNGMAHGVLEPFIESVRRKRERGGKGKLLKQVKMGKCNFKKQWYKIWSRPACSFTVIVIILLNGDKTMTQCTVVFWCSFIPLFWMCFSVCYVPVVSGIDFSFIFSCSHYVSFPFHTHEKNQRSEFLSFRNGENKYTDRHRWRHTCINSTQQNNLS